MIDPVFPHAAANLIRNSLQLLSGIAHGNAAAHRLQHGDIIFAVAESDGLCVVKAVVRQDLFHAQTLSAAGGDDIHRAIPPAGDLRALHPLQNKRILRLAAAGGKL